MLTIQLSSKESFTETKVIQREVTDQQRKEIEQMLEEILGVLPTVFCKHCDWEGTGNDLEPFCVPEDECSPAYHDLGCPNCGTNYYLSNIEDKK